MSLDPTRPRILAACLFVDPGPTRSAFAHLVAYDNGIIEPRALWYIEFGDTDASESRLRNELHRLDGVDDAAFVVETIVGGIYGTKGKGGSYRKRRASYLWNTKEVEALLKRGARRAGYPVVEMSAPHWRSVLLGNAAASNAQIRYAVEQIYSDRATGRSELPATDAVAREHCYDAVGGGLVWLAEHLAWPCPKLPATVARALAHRLSFPGGLLPQHIREGVMKIRMQEGADRQAAKLAEELGVELPKKPRRKPTRAVAHAAQVKRQATKFRKKLMGR